MIRFIKRTINELCNIINVVFKFFYSIIALCSCALKTIIRGKRFKKDENKNKKILVLGNGPSLNDINLKELSKKYDIACVNWFAKNNPVFYEIKPKYYFLIDPSFFDMDSKTYYDKRTQVKELTDAFDKVDWEMIIISPQKGKLSTKNEHIKYSHITTEQLAADSFKKLYYLFYNNNLAVCGLQNVMCAALHFSISTGFSEVYIAGVDFDELKSYSVNKDNHVRLVYKHFYGEKIIDCTETNYIPKGTFYKWMGYFAKMLKELYYLSEYAKSKGVKVYNLTPNSFIDFFEKIDWESLL